MERQVLITAINYANEQEVLEYVRHVALQSAKEQIAVAIVGNKWSENGKQILSKGIASVELDVRIYDPGENLGYLNGTLYGYAEYVKETGEKPRWIAISNTDIEYDSEEFYQKFLDTPYAEDIGCVAPSIHVPATGAYENPRYKIRFTRQGLEKRIKVFSSNYVSMIYQRLGAIKAGLHRGGKKESQYVYIAHGSFFLICQELADALLAWPYGALLYSEEAYVAEMAIQIGKREYYDAGIQVIHHESAVTGKLNNPVRAKMYVDSLTMVRDRFFTDHPAPCPLEQKDVCAVVVSYNGEEKLEGNLQALCRQVDRIVVVDNGSNDRTRAQLEMWKQRFGVELICNESNLGIGAALQQGLDYAREQGYALLLTMDQDSCLAETAVEEMLAVLNRHSCVAAVGPEYGPAPDAAKADKSEYKVQYLITSGNLVRVNAAYCAGGYQKELFIDSVDFDFSLMLRQNGYELMKAPKAFMYHGIGEKTPVKTWIGTRCFWTHSPVRHYYIVRNHRYLCKKYGKQFKLFCFKKRLSMLRSAAEVLLFHPNRRENYKMMRKGRRDARKGKYGVYTP